MSFLLGLPIFRGYVKFQGCNGKYPAVFFSSVAHQNAQDITDFTGCQQAFTDGEGVSCLGDGWVMKNSGGVRWGPDPGAVFWVSFWVIFWVNMDGTFTPKGSLAKGNVKDIIVAESRF